MTPPIMQPSLLRFLFLNLCWIVFLFSWIRICNADPSPPNISTTNNLDGALPASYDKNVALDGKQVTFSWTLSQDTISIKAKGEAKSGYLAIGFGTGMIKSYAYVGWLDESGMGKVSTYWIEGKTPTDIHLTKENLTKVNTKSEDGIITFEFTRVLNPSCDPNAKIECGNIIDPNKPLNVIWAMGPKWSEDTLSKSNMHFANSENPTAVKLTEGTSSMADKGLPAPFVVHGILMFIGWGIILPAGVICARYLKHLNGDTWFQLHLYLQYSGLAIVIIAFIIVVVTMKGLQFDALHVRFGYLAILLGVIQPVNAFFRPPKSTGWEKASRKRIVWEYIHIIGGRSAIIVAFATLITGLRFLSVQYVRKLTYSLTTWIVIIIAIVIFMEVRERKRRRRAKMNEVGDSDFQYGT